MAFRSPLIIDSGRTRQIQAGDLIDPDFLYTGLTDNYLLMFSGGTLANSPLFDDGGFNINFTDRAIVANSQNDFLFGDFFNSGGGAKIAITQVGGNVAITAPRTVSLGDNDALGDGTSITIHADGAGISCFGLLHLGEAPVDGLFLSGFGDSVLVTTDDEVQGLTTAGLKTFLTSPTSANLAALLTDELGSGKVIFSAGALAVASSKTLTVSESMTLTAANASKTFTFPGNANDTVALLALAQTFTGVNTFADGIQVRSASAAVTTTGIDIIGLTDPQNGAVTAFKMRPTLDARRLYFGDSSHTWYALNLQYVSSIENHPELRFVMGKKIVWDPSTSTWDYITTENTPSFLSSYDNVMQFSLYDDTNNGAFCFRGGNSNTTRATIFAKGGTCIGTSTTDPGAGKLRVQTAILIGTDQVVGTRDTGWAAMTGSSNKATAYDTSTVTLAQLAGRVMAIQAALTTHGLFGA